MKSETGFVIALAWPETYCKQAGAWYDGLMNLFGFAKNNYYKVGHAALVLVNGVTGDCHYYDFGRYHAPFGHGRVRNHETDFDLGLNIKALVNEQNQIDNFSSILKAVFENPACHGTGKLHASYCSVDYTAALDKAISMQGDSPYVYGPFVYSGTNCSRFVRTVILSGKPALKYRFKLAFPITFSPTPKTNVEALAFKTMVVDAGTPDLGCTAPSVGVHSTYLGQTLPPPIKPASIPDAAQWLAGEGAGSWFHIEEKNKHYTVSRFDSNGQVECRSVFNTSNLQNVQLLEKYEFIHPCHCKEIHILQNDLRIVLSRVDSLTGCKKITT
jgi:hypothetical protein